MDQCTVGNKWLLTRQLVNSNGDLRDSRSTELAVPIRMWKFSCKRLAMLVGFMRSVDTRSLAQTYIHLHHYAFFPDFCLCLLNIDGSSYNRFTRRTYTHIRRRSSHHAFETEDISAIHQLISDTVNTFSYNLMRKRWLIIIGGHIRRLWLKTSLLRHETHL